MRARDYLPRVMAAGLALTAAGCSAGGLSHTNFKLVEVSHTQGVDLVAGEQAGKDKQIFKVRAGYNDIRNHPEPVEEAYRRRNKDLDGARD